MNMEIPQDGCSIIQSPFIPVFIDESVHFILVNDFLQKRKYESWKPFGKPGIFIAENSLDIQELFRDWRKIPPSFNLAILIHKQ
jgi:hypothetical protein